MHQLTGTIKKIWPPFKPTDTRTNIEFADGGKFRIELVRLANLSEGDNCSYGYTNESFQGKPFKLIKDIALASEVTAFHPARGVVKAGNGNGEIDIRSIFGLMHSYNGKLPTISQMVLDLRRAQEALQLFEKGGVIEDLEDTLDN